MKFGTRFVVSLYSLALTISATACAGFALPTPALPPPQPEEPEITLIEGRDAEFAATCAAVYQSELGRAIDAAGAETCLDKCRRGATAADLVAWLRSTPEFADRQARLEQERIADEERRRQEEEEAQHDEDKTETDDTPAPAPPGPCEKIAATTPLGIVCRERARLDERLTEAQIADLLRTIVRRLNAEGVAGGPYGLLRKTSGAQCDGYSCDIVCVGNGPEQRQWDILVDAEGARPGRPQAEPVWRLVNPMKVRVCVPVEPSK